MSFFHHHHNRPNVEVDIVENIRQPNPCYQQPPTMVEVIERCRQPYGQVLETVEVVKRGPYGNIEVDTITERVTPNGTMVVEEVRREGYGSGW